jgi:hypothetical protein
MNKMMKYLQFSLVAFLMTTIVSCEKVVELDLDDAQQMIVVEGIVHDSIGDNFVLLSKSKSFNDNNGSFEKVTGASVIISDNLGNIFTLSETEPGRYQSSTLEGISGRKYLLNITVSGKTITSESTMPQRVALDSLSYEEVDNPFGGDNESGKKEYRVYTHFRDPLGVVNYYRIKGYNGGVQEKGFLTLNDDLIEGADVDFPLFLSKFEEGDTAVVHLLSVDEVNHRYFSAIEASQDGEVPGNPESNIEGENVVGYFGAYAKSQKAVVITPL